MIRRCDECEVDEDTGEGCCWSCGQPWTALGSILHSPVGAAATRRGSANPTDRASLLAAGYTGATM